MYPPSSRHGVSEELAKKLLRLQLNKRHVTIDYMDSGVEAGSDSSTFVFKRFQHEIEDHGVFVWVGYTEEDGDAWVTGPPQWVPAQENMMKDILPLEKKVGRFVVTEGSTCIYPTETDKIK